VMERRYRMISDEERREVARKLRFNACTALHMNTSDDFAREVFRAAMNEEVVDYRAAIKRLADLIEPSCDALQETADEDAAAYADAETMQDERDYRYQRRIGSVTLKSNNGYDLLDAMLELGA